LTTIATVQADFVEAGGTRLRVRRWGQESAPAVVYWHGGGGGSDEWPRIAPALEEAGYAVYAPEAPGYGASPALEPERYLASSVADIAGQLIKELRIAPVVWIGFSWGASIGVHAAARYQDRVRALVLLDGGYRLPADDPDDDPRLDFHGRMEQWRRELEQQEEPDEAPPEVVAAAMAGSNMEPAVPLLPRLEAAATPVVLIASSRPAQRSDFERAIQRFRAALPSAEVVCIEGGHGVLQEAGDEVRRIVLNWLAGLD
jgi:pimeloyl-ACP methyl ester carboxylesterase